MDACFVYSTTTLVITLNYPGKTVLHVPVCDQPKKNRYFSHRKSFGPGLTKNDLDYMQQGSGFQVSRTIKI